MSRLLVRNFSISIDGYAAGPHQDLDHPLGIGGTQLHQWIFATRSGRQMIGEEGGSEGLDDDFFSRAGIWCGCHHHGSEHVWPDTWPRGARATGPAGGERNPPFITRCSCSPTNRVLLSKCRGEQLFISLTVGLKPLSEQPSRRPVTRMSLSEVAPPPSGSTSVLRSSMKCTSRLCPSCWVAANESSTISARAPVTTAVSNTFARRPLSTSASHRPVAVSTADYKAEEINAVSESAPMVHDSVLEVPHRPTVRR